MISKVILYLMLIIGFRVNAMPTYTDPNFDKLVDAIYWAEGGGLAKHPYGIMQKYQHTTSKQACMNTIKHAWKDFKATARPESEFLPFLQKRYAPIGVANDPKGLNKNWLGNVTKIYNRK